MNLKTFVSLVFFLGLLQSIKTKCKSRYKYRNLNKVQIKLLLRQCSDGYNVATRITNRVRSGKNWNSPKVDLSWNIKETVKTLDRRDSEDFSDTSIKDSSLNINEPDESFDISDSEKFFATSDKHSDSFETVFKMESKNLKTNGYQFLRASNAIDEVYNDSLRVRDKRRKPKQTCTEKPIYIYVPVESTGLIDVLEWQDKGIETNGEGIFRRKPHNDDNDFSLCSEAPTGISAQNKNSDLSFCGDSINKPSKNATENLGKDENSNVSSLCGNEPDDRNPTPSSQVTPIKKTKKKSNIKDLADLLPPNSLETELFDKTDLRIPKIPKNRKIDAGDAFSIEALDKAIFDTNESFDNKKIKVHNDDLAFIDSIDTTNNSIDSIDSQVKEPFQNDNFVSSKDYTSIETLFNSDMNEFFEPTQKRRKINSTNGVLAENSLERFFIEPKEASDNSNIIDKSKSKKNETTGGNNSTEKSRSLNSNSFQSITSERSIPSKEISLGDSSEKSSSCDNSEKCTSPNITIKITISDNDVNTSIVTQTSASNSDSHSPIDSSKTLIDSPATKRPERIYKRDKFGNNIDIVSDEILSNSKASSTSNHETKPTKKYILNRNGDIIDPLTGNPVVILDWNSVGSTNRGKRKRFMHDKNGFIIQIDPEINDKSNWHSAQTLDRKRKKVFRLDKNHNLIDIINFDESKEITKESINYNDSEIIIVESSKKPIGKKNNTIETTPAGSHKVSVERSVSTETEMPTKKLKTYKDKFDNIIEVNSIENEDLSTWTSANSLIKRNTRQYKINKYGELVDAITGEIEKFSFSVDIPKSKYKLDRHGNIINVFPDDIDDNSNWLDTDDHDKRSKKTFKVDKYGNLIDIIDIISPNIKPEHVRTSQSSNETKDENEEVSDKQYKSKLFDSKIDVLSFDSYDLSQYPDVSKYLGKAKVNIVVKYPEMFMDTGCDKVQTAPINKTQSEPNSDYDIDHYGNLLKFSDEMTNKQKVPIEMFQDTVCEK